MNPFQEVKVQRYILPKVINCSPKEVYDVVAEVSKYHEFIPYCEDSFVNVRDPVTTKPKVAGLKVGFKQYDEKFVCNIHCEVDGEDVHVVTAESISHHLFDVLNSKWTIRPHPTRKNASSVELRLKFKFKSRIYNSVSSLFAKSVTEIVMDALARRVYHLKKASSLEKSKI